MERMGSMRETWRGLAFLLVLGVAVTIGGYFITALDLLASERAQLRRDMALAAIVGAAIGSFAFALERRRPRMFAWATVPKLTPWMYGLLGLLMLVSSRAPRVLALGAAGLAGFILPVLTPWVRFPLPRRASADADSEDQLRLHRGDGGSAPRSDGSGGHATR
jgi:hypothetical protein